LGWSTALAQAGRTPLSFEVASLKPIPLPADTGNDYADGYNAGARAALSGMGLRIAGQRVTATETSLRDLIHIAYQVQDRLLSGPSWMATEKFDLVATMPASVDRSKAPEMLRTLLEERFHLKLHRETKRMSVYTLVAARGGPKLKASAPPANGASPNPRTMFQPGMLMTRSASLAAFADLISKASDRPVVDATGLKGLYDIDLRYSPDPRDVPPDGEPRPTLVTGLQEQLGLRLQSRNQQMELLVIDSADKVPVEN
jgi:uncharacterized protein (TIGR03435 family)